MFSNVYNPHTVMQVPKKHPHIMYTYSDADILLNSPRINDVRVSYNVTGDETSRGGTGGTTAKQVALSRKKTPAATVTMGENDVSKQSRFAYITLLTRVDDQLSDDKVWATTNNVAASVLTQMGALGEQLRSTSTIGADRVILTFMDIELHAPMQKYLSDHGWTRIVRVGRNHPAFFDSCKSCCDWPGQYIKMYGWNMTEYTRVVMLDSDYCVFKAPDHLFRMNVAPDNYAGCRMIGQASFLQPPISDFHLSGGHLMVLQPSSTTFDTFFTPFRRNPNFPSAFACTEIEFFSSVLQSKFEELDASVCFDPAAYNTKPDYRGALDTINWLHGVKAYNYQGLKSWEWLQHEAVASVVHKCYAKMTQPLIRARSFGIVPKSFELSFTPDVSILSILSKMGKTIHSGSLGVCSVKSVGPAGDKAYGSHPLCGRKYDKCGLISYGVDYEYTFEVHVKNVMGCSVVAMDPTVDHKPELAPGVRFFKHGAPMPASRNTPGWKTVPPHEAARHFDADSQLLLKMDCEGCEYAIHGAVPDDFFKRVDQFALEVHVAKSLGLISLIELTALANLYQTLENAGLELADVMLTPCAAHDEASGVLPELLSTGYHVKGEGMCQNLLFARRVPRPGPKPSTLPKLAKAIQSASKPDVSSQPYLSMVVVTRNDGDAALRRLQNSIDYNLFLLKKYGVNTEYIVVDYNSDPALPSVQKQLTHRDGLRVLTVPPHLAASVDTKHKLLVDFGKNIGIRRAHGRFILAMNIDNMLSDALAAHIGKQKLRSDVFYRVYRANTDMPSACTTNMQSTECTAALVEQVHAVRYGPFKTPVENERYGSFNPTSAVGLACSDACTLGEVSETCMHASKMRVKTHTSDSFDIGNDQVSQFHTSASGDFLLMSRRAWGLTGGYHEVASTSHLDSWMLCKSVAAGLTEIAMYVPCVVWHQNHPKRNHGSGILNGWDWSTTRCKEMALGKLEVDRREFNSHNKSDWGRLSWGDLDLPTQSHLENTPEPPMQILAPKSTPPRCTLGYKEEQHEFVNAGRNLIRKLYTPDKWLRNGAVVIEFGSFTGVDLSVFGNAAPHKDYEVHTYEPSKEAFLQLKTILKKFPNMYVHNYGVGIEDRIACHHGSGVAAKITYDMTSCNNPVQMKALSTTLSTFSFIDVIQINCEGCEIDIIKALHASGANHIRWVEMQVHKPHVTAEQYCDIERAMRDMGFEISYRYEYVWELWENSMTTLQNIKIIEQPRQQVDTSLCTETVAFEWLTNNLGNILQSYFELVAMTILKHCTVKFSSLNIPKDTFQLPHKIVPTAASFLWSGEVAPTSPGPPGGLWHTPAARVLHAITPVIQDIIEPLLNDVSLEANHIIIHFRCSDSPPNRHWGYEFLRYHYYFAALQLMNTTTDMPIMVLSCTGWNGGGRAGKEMCTSYATKLVGVLRDAGYKVDVVCGKSVEEDFSRMVKAPKLISGGVSSSLSYMAALASHNLAVIPSTIPSIGKRPSIANHAHQLRDGLYILHLDDGRLPHSDVKDYSNIETVHSQLLQGYKRSEPSEKNISTTLIPQIIHQFWTGKQLPPIKLLNRCKNIHKGWKHMFWSDVNITSGHLKLKNQKIYDCEPENGKSDVLRYEVLQKYGGFWIDADAVCLRSLDSLRNHSIVSGYESYDNPTLNGKSNYKSKLVGSVVIGALPNHHVLNSIIHSLNNNPDICKGPPWMEVGPLLLTKHLEKHNVDPILPFYMFTPYHHTETIDHGLHKLKKYNSFTLNLWGTTFGVNNLFSRIDTVLGDLL